MFQDKHNITTVSFLLTRWDRQDTECVTLTDCLQHLSQSVKHEKLITELNNHKDNTFSGICFFFLTHCTLRNAPDSLYIVMYTANISASLW